VKLVLFQTVSNAEIRPGVLTDRGVVDVFAAVKQGYTPQHTMQGIIDEFDTLRPSLQELAAAGEALPVDSIPYASSRRCRGREKSSPASPIIGSTSSASRARSTCS
jgi:hypothetical protein